MRLFGKSSEDEPETKKPACGGLLIVIQSRQLDRLSQNAFGMVERLADRTINVIATPDGLAADGANCRPGGFAQGPELFGIVA